jgi:hypothetical protein
LDRHFRGVLIHPTVTIHNLLKSLVSNVSMSIPVK